MLRMLWWGSQFERSMALFPQAAGGASDRADLQLWAEASDGEAAATQKASIACRWLCTAPPDAQAVFLMQKSPSTVGGCTRRHTRMHIITTVLFLHADAALPDQPLLQNNTLLLSHPPASPLSLPPTQKIAGSLLESLEIRYPSTYPSTNPRRPKYSVQMTMNANWGAHIRVPTPYL